MRYKVNARAGVLYLRKVGGRELQIPVERGGVFARAVSERSAGCGQVKVRYKVNARAGVVALGKVGGRGIPNLLGAGAKIPRLETFNFTPCEGQIMFEL